MSGAETKYAPTKKKPGKAKAFFICLIISAFLWLVHSLNAVYTRNFKVPVSYRNIPQNKQPLNPLPEMLSVDVKASGLKLALIQLKRPFSALDVDFNQIKAPGRGQNYVLSSQSLNFKRIFGFEAQIRHISPDTLYFSEKTGFQKTVTIKVPMYLKCRQGFAARRPQISPAFTTIFGDTALIRNIDTIYTQPLQLNDLYQNVNTRVTLIKPGDGVYPGLSEASVSIEVDKLVEHQARIPITDIRSRNNGNNISVFPSHVTVRFTSSGNNFRSEDTALFRASINSEKMNRGTKKYPVFLNMVPGHVTVLEIEPREVEVLILKH